MCVLVCVLSQLGRLLGHVSASRRDAVALVTLVLVAAPLSIHDVTYVCVFPFICSSPLSLALPSRGRQSLKRHGLCSAHPSERTRAWDTALLYSHRHAGDEGVPSLLRTYRCSRIHARYTNPSARFTDSPACPSLSSRRERPPIRSRLSVRSRPLKRRRCVTRHPPSALATSVRSVDYPINTKKKKSSVFVSVGCC